METATVRFLCNPPAGFRGKVHFMFAVNDETVAEGYSGDVLTAELPKGKIGIQVLVRNEGLNSMSGTTPVLLEGDMSLKVKYALFGKSASLVPNRESDCGSR